MILSIQWLALTLDSLIRLGQGLVLLLCRIVGFHLILPEI